MKKILAYSLRSLTALLGTLGVGLELYNKGLFMLTYYTLLSNILVVGMSYYLLFRMLKDFDEVMEDRGLLRLKGAITMGILLTCLVYHFMLAPFADASKFFRLENFLVHYIVPILFLLDWLILDKRGVYKGKDAFYWTLLPLGYSIFALIKGYVFQIEIPGQENSPYPYFFLNIDRFGFLGVIQFVIGISIAYLAMSGVLYFIKMFRAGDENES